MDDISKEIWVNIIKEDMKIKKERGFGCFDYPEESAIAEKSRLTEKESCYLEQGITQGIV